MKRTITTRLFLTVCGIVLTVLSVVFLIASPVFAQEAPKSDETLTQAPSKTSEEGNDAQGVDIGALANLPGDEFFKGKIVEILGDDQISSAEGSQMVQKVKIRITNGNESGLEVEGLNNIPSGGNKHVSLNKGDEVTVVKVYTLEEPQYYVVDYYRLPILGYIFFLFLILVIFFGRLKGFASILGLIFSILVLAMFVVPQILAGHDPLLISLSGALVIVFVSLYLAHGFTARTTVALAGTLVTLGIAAGCAIAFVTVAKLFGTGSEDALYLQFGPTATLNLRGLFLGGIIIGTLGVLDDVTTAQAAAIDEIKKANEALDFSELYHRGISVGREHISSLVNTLALAYAGVSLPLFLLFSMNNVQPLWVTLNSQSIAEEIVRTLVGSVAIMLAVPITTFFAAYYFGRDKTKKITELPS